MHTPTEPGGWARLPGPPCELGESPFWHAAEGRLYWIDIARQQLLRAVPGEAPDTWPLPQQPGCIAPARDGGLVIALRDGVWRQRTWAGPLERLAPAAHDPTRQRFNDGKCDAEGRLWAGTLVDARDSQDAALWCLHHGTLHRMAGGATVANGLAFSPDGRTAYWADTTAHTVRSYERDPADGALSNARTFLQFDPKPAGWQPGQGGYGGRPDGAAVDAHGNYWVALYEGGRLLCVSPAGAVLEDIATPARCPTMPCFGGDDLRTLYLTTAREKRPADELAQFPDSGCVFARRVAVPGLAACAFAG